MRHRLILILAALLVIAAVPASAQTVEHDCADGVCTAAEAVAVADLTGQFRHGHAVPEARIDLRAALEQQRWREFRFLAGAPARLFAEVTAEPMDRPADWPAGAAFPGPPPALTLLVSLDGNRFQPVGNGAAVSEGAIVAVILGQPVSGGEDGAITYHPLRWRLSVSASPVWPEGSPPPSGDFGDLFGQLPGDPLPDFDPLPADPTEGAVEDCVGDDCAAPAPAPSIPQTSPASSDLAASLQAELSRVGCYTAAIDGLWGPASRAAMAAFNAASGSDAPIDPPTPGALVAVARATGRVCSGG